MVCSSSRLTRGRPMSARRCRVPRSAEWRIWMSFLPYGELERNPGGDGPVWVWNEGGGSRRAPTHHVTRLIEYRL